MLDTVDLTVINNITDSELQDNIEIYSTVMFAIVSNIDYAILDIRKQKDMTRRMIENEDELIELLEYTKQHITDVVNSYRLDIKERFIYD